MHGSYAHWDLKFVMDFVNILVEGQPLILAMRKSMKPVKEEPITRHKNAYLLQDGDRIRYSFSSEVHPGELKVV